MKYLVYGFLDEKAESFPTLTIHIFLNLLILHTINLYIIKSCGKKTWNIPKKMSSYIRITEGLQEWSKG
jgi:hypothetical protein